MDLHNDFSRVRFAQPIPAAHAEPLERLIDALRPNGVLFLLRVGPDIDPRWLTETRIAKYLYQALMEPVQTDVWPLLPDVWAISLHTNEDREHPTSALHVQSLRRTLVERLENAWRLENETAAREESGREEPEREESASLREESATLPGATVGQTETLVASSGLPIPPFLPAFTLLPIAPLQTVDERETNVDELNSLLDIIVTRQLHAQFQPIIDLQNGQVIGYEALIRGPKGGLLRRPGALFRAAAKAHMVSWFDLACQEQCFARAAEMGLRHLLFINMEAEGLAYLDMQDRPLATRAREHGLSPASIVIEITERQAVDDFPLFMNALNRLREQGFKIAIDDAGAGYNSLHTIAEIRPDFVKVDRALVRNLDVNGERRALLSALVQYARSIGTQILAEGSETYEELSTLIDLGVTYGQGYLMGKPADTFRGISKSIRDFILQRQLQRGRIATGRLIAIGGLARPGKLLPPDAPMATAATAFFKNPSLTSVAVVEDGHVRGLLMRHALDHILEMARSAQMAALAPEETVAQWMQTNYLRVGEKDSVGEVARQATTRSDLSLESDLVIVDSSDHYVGVVPIRVLMEAVTALQENHCRYADPLTGLPNRVALEQVLQERLNEPAPVALVRIDLTGLAAYNQSYSLSHGDNVIRTLAQLIEATLQATAAPPFIAHLGGDDFVVLMDPIHAAHFCQSLLQEYTRRRELLYTAEHLRLGRTEMADRHGNKTFIPLMDCTAAVITNRSRRFHHPVPMLMEANALLQQIKVKHGHGYAIDCLPTNQSQRRV